MKEKVMKASTGMIDVSKPSNIKYKTVIDRNKRVNFRIAVAKAENGSVE